ncbi:MAG: class I SAM-dependent methyltransferase, partial [Alphaproteobacteria bacterium]
MVFGKRQRHGRKPRLSERLFRRFVFKYFAQNLLVDLQLQAKRESLEYINAHMMHCSVFADRWDLLHYAIGQAKSEGMVMEFGVFKGDSIRAIADWSQRQVHGFDSFEGLPEDWTGSRGLRGLFNTRGRLPKVPANVTLHAGWFDETLPPFLAEHTDTVALLNIDCDIYSSTKTIFDALAKRIGPGTIVSFDEYFNYHGWQRHEFKAFQEYVQTYGVRYEYLGFTASAGTIVLRILETG